MIADEDTICQYRYAAPCSGLVVVLIGSLLSAIALAGVTWFAKEGIRIAEVRRQDIRLTETETKIAGGLLALCAGGIGCVAAWKLSERFASDTRIAVTETHLILPGLEPDFGGRVLERRIPFDAITALSLKSDKASLETVEFTFEAESQSVSVRREYMPNREAFEEVLHLVQRRVTWRDRELPDYVAEEVQHHQHVQQPAFLVMAVPFDSLDLRLEKVKEFTDEQAAEEFAAFLREGSAFKQIEVRERPAATHQPQQEL